MFDVTRAARQAEIANLTYSTFLRDAEVVEAPLPEGVTVVRDARFCGCFDDNCFFCTAVDDAVYQAAWEDEQAEWEDKHPWLYLGYDEDDFAVDDVVPGAAELEARLSYSQR